MPTVTTSAKEHRKRWQDIVEDPLLSELPYKVETNHRGQIVLGPNQNRHARRRTRIEKRLDDLLGSGEALQEWAIATTGGTKQVDVIWTSDERLKQMEKTGDPTTLAPEICVEVMSESNDWEEMQAKMSLYRESGAEEVWVVQEDGSVRFFGAEELERSVLAPGP